MVYIKEIELKTKVQKYYFKYGELFSKKEIKK